MKVQAINNNTPSFGALNLTADAKALIESQKGGKDRIKIYTKELQNSRWDLNIQKIKSDNEIFSTFGRFREGAVIPGRLQDEFIMVYSLDARKKNSEDNIVDCLKFSSAERAKEVYNNLIKLARAKAPNENLYKKTVIQHLDWDVYAMKAFTEAELVPQEKSPWAHFLTKETAEFINQRFKEELQQGSEFIEIHKSSFTQRLKAAWNVLLGK